MEVMAFEKNKELIEKIFSMSKDNEQGQHGNAERARRIRIEIKADQRQTGKGEQSR